MTAPAPIVPRYHVQAPTPAPDAKYSLLSAATVLDNVPPHQLTGIEYEAVCSTQVDGYPAPCEPGTDDLSRQKEAHDSTSVTIATPFVLYAADPCVLGRDETDAEAQLRRRFLAGEPAAVERVVETGKLANWPNLHKQPQIIPTRTGEATLEDAIGLLEQWLAETTGTVGVLHAPRTVAPRVFREMQARTQGPRASTVLDSTWVFGTGYTGTAPAGQDGSDRMLWLYATPPVTVRRSNLSQPATWHTGAFDIATNSAFLLLERIYVVDWPCAVAAVKTNVPLPGAAPAPATRHHTTATVTEGATA